MREKTGADGWLDFFSNPFIHKKHEERERNPRLTRSYHVFDVRVFRAFRGQQLLYGAANSRSGDWNSTGRIVNV